MSTSSASPLSRIPLRRVPSNRPPPSIPRPSPSPSGLRPALRPALPPPAPRLVSLSSADLVEEEQPSKKPASIPPPLPPRRSLGAVGRVSERDALGAARACLDELAQLVPCRVALVHWLDVVRRDFVVAHARGDGAESMVLERSSYDDPLLRIAMQKNEPFAWGDLRKAPVSRLGRFAGLGAVRTVLVCPIVSGPRQLGAVELVDPFDVRFRTNDIVSARRVTEGYASFLAAHGLVVDIANIARFAARSMER